MDQNGTKDNNGHDLNEKKLPEDPVSLYIVSFLVFNCKFNLVLAGTRAW